MCIAVSPPLGSVIAKRLVFSLVGNSIESVDTVGISVSSCRQYTVGDSGVGQQQLNGRASKNTLQLAEFDENQCITSL